ncbi:hypothetical protein BLA28_29390 [Eisenbergiella tayi]|nr:hypothetical protein BLA28_29390 [Eisenbergiella tayi]
MCGPSAPCLPPALPFCLAAADCLPGGFVYPAQARFRSAENAAVLRLQRTQSKDRRFQKAFAGYTNPPGRQSAAARQKGRAGGRQGALGSYGMYKEAVKK